MEEKEELECCSYYKSFYEVSLDMTMEERIMFEDVIFRYFYYDEPIPETTGNRIVDIVLKSIIKVLEKNKKRGVSSRKGAAKRKNSKTVETTLQKTETDFEQSTFSVETDLKPFSEKNIFGCNRFAESSETVTTDLKPTCKNAKPNKKEIINNKIINKDINNKQEEKINNASSETDVKEVGDFEFETWSASQWDNLGLDVMIDGEFTINQFIDDMKPYSCGGVYSVPAYLPYALKKKIEKEMSKVYPQTRMEY